MATLLGLTALFARLLLKRQAAANLGHWERAALDYSPVMKS
ncbi:hypothetical protein [[Phormidium] sp. LEGE 05292]|nr:hypothetical protein [Phormidium sp. LEGE 05292]